MNHQNLKGVRDAVRVRTGLTEKGETGDDRLNVLVNLAERQLWNDQPDVFQKREVRIILQPAIGTTESAGNPTLDVSPVDARCFRFSDPSSVTSLTSAGGTRATLVGRWIDIEDSDGNVHTRRILSTANSVTTNEDWGDGVTAHSLIFVDRPWINNTDEGLTFRIYTLDYPLPADVVDITAVYRNPEHDGFDELTAVYPAELDRLRLGAWTESGLPEAYSDGDFFQLRAPHDTPSVSKTSGSSDLSSWGYDSSGVEQTSYGQAGTFSYCYCLVLGRLDSPSRALMGANSSDTEYQRAPFYISAPSPASEQIETTWGGGMISVGSVDQDWHEVRKVQMGATAAAALLPVSGLEKWWFRACHASAADNPSLTGLPTEADGVYRLWRIEQGTSIVVRDRGDFDPVDYNFPLKEFTGHKSIRFDRTPSEGSPVEILIRATVRPPLLSADTDVLPVPPNAVEAIVNKVCHYLAERDGDLNKAGYYSSLYESQVNKLRESHGWTSTKKPGFGDGITVSGTRSWRMAPKIRALDS